MIYILLSIIILICLIVIFVQHKKYDSYLKWHDAAVKYQGTISTLLNNIEELKKEEFDIQMRHKYLSDDIEMFEQEKQQLIKEKQNLLDNEHNRIQEEREKNNQIIAQMLEDRLDTINVQFEQETEKVGIKYQQAVEDFQNSYAEVLQDSVSSYITEINKKTQQLDNLNKQITDAKQKWSVIIETFKEDQKKKDQINFYKIQISDEDLNEINQLKEVVPYLKHQEPLMKAIWEVYYKKPFSDLIGRLIGQNIKCGIYKITNTLNNMSYIGQSVNIKDRFRTHVRKGLGVETRTRNKLYLAMDTDGIENFTFEILEECPREKLNEKERYWINFFKTQEFGYNETRGNT